jgi:transcriptional regulator with XRE-family HTH domain
LKGGDIMDNKNIFAKNLKRYMDISGKSRREVSEALGVSYYTFSDWVNGKKYPRMGKVEALAQYFGILKSDLIEEKTEEHREMQKKNDALSDIIIEMRTDDEFMSIVEAIYKMDKEKRSSLLTFLK